jgi:hypothetical protein
MVYYEFLQERISKMKRLILTTILLILALMIAVPAFGARLTKKQLEFVDEFGNRITHTTITSVNIQDAGTSTTSSIYSDRNGETSMTNPIVTGLTDDAVEFWSKDADYKVTATDGTYTRTVDNLTGSQVRLAFPTYLVAMSSRTASDSQTFTFGTDSDWVAGAADSTMDWTPAVDDSAFAIGTAAYTSDLYLYGGTSGYNLYWDASEDTLELLDNVTLAIGTGDDYTIVHNGTTTTVAGAATYSGDTTFSTDFLFDGTYDVAWDDNRNQLIFEDNAVLGFGGAHDAAGDVTFSWNATNLLIESAAEDTGEIEIGATNAIDLVLHANTAASEVAFNASTATAEFNGYDIQLMDDDILAFGDSDEITIQYDEDGDNDLQVIGDVTLEGTTPLLTIGDAGAEDAQITFDGNAHDFGFGLDDTTDDLVISQDGALGTGNIISIADVPTTILLHDASEADASLNWDGNAKDFRIALDDSADDLEIGLGTTVETTERLTISGHATNSLITIGDAAEADQYIVLDGNAQDFYFGLDDTDDDLNIGVGAVVGTTAAIEVTEDARVTITTALNIPYEDVTATNTITADEGGKIFYLNSATEFVSTLPTASTAGGMVVTFVIKAAPSGADYTVSTGNSHEDVMYGLIQESETDTTEDGPTAQAQDRINFKDGVAVIGDYVILNCDGTNWYVQGMTAADGGITFDTQ